MNRLMYTGARRPTFLSLTTWLASHNGKAITLVTDVAGRLGSNTRRTGEILINGRKQVLAYGTSVWKEDAVLYKSSI